MLETIINFTIVFTCLGVFFTGFISAHSNKKKRKENEILNSINDDLEMRNGLLWAEVTGLTEQNKSLEISNEYFMHNEIKFEMQIKILRGNLNPSQLRNIDHVVEKNLTELKKENINA